MDLFFHPDGQSFYSITYAGDLTRWELNPEIFVLKYYEDAYRKELPAEPVFEARRKGESKKDHLARLEEAAVKKTAIITRYHKLYLSEREK